MSFGGRAYGGFLDYRDLLPRRIRRALELVLLAIIVLKPALFVSMATEHAERSWTEVWERVEPHLGLPTTTTTQAP